MITCLSWIKRGVAKEVPDKVELTKEELQELVSETQEKLSSIENQDGLVSSQAHIQDAKMAAKEMEDNEDLKEFDLENYDNEEGNLMLSGGLEGLVYHTSPDEDPYITVKNEVDAEEREDFCIKSTDNLIAVGKVEEDYCGIDVHIYNAEEGSFYVHHDILLDSFPLVIEWLNFDPNLQDGEIGNYIAIGTMEQHIEVWDLDIVDAIEPSFILGKRKKKKKKVNVNNTGHSDAVLGLSWNTNVRNVLASGSGDNTVVLWDMSQLTGVHRLKHHNDKVQCVEWHPFEAQLLLTGSFDKTAKVVDCRSPEACLKSWELKGELEQTVWDNFSPFQFLAATDAGQVYCCDVRTDKPVFVIDAHQGSVAGISLSSKVRGCLSTTGSDKMMKVWDITDNKPVFVASREMKMGRLHCVSSCPDENFTFAYGGEKDGLRVQDLLEMTDANNYFSNRSKTANSQHVPSSGSQEAPDNGQDQAMDTAETGAAAATALASLSLGTGQASGNNAQRVVVKKKKKKKKH